MSTRIETVKEEGAMHHALQRLQSMIFCGEVLPGEHIRQQELAGELGLSRVPLREALNVLARSGLLIHRPHQGYYVAKRAPHERAQLRRMLELLEGELIETLEWPDESILQQLTDINDRMAAYSRAETWHPIIELNREFHLVIFSLSPHTLILDQVRRLWDLAAPYLYEKLVQPATCMRNVQEHAELIEALRAQDRAACQRIMNAHRVNTERA